MSGVPPEIVVSGSENHTLQLTGIEAARLVGTAVSRLGDPSSGRYAIIGGLAILCRCRTAERVGWTGSASWFRENVARIRPSYARIDPADRLIWEPGDAAQCDQGSHGQ